MSVEKVRERRKSSCRTPRISCRAAARLTAVWSASEGRASPYTTRWPRPVNFMRMLDGSFLCQSGRKRAVKLYDETSSVFGGTRHGSAGAIDGTEFPEGLSNCIVREGRRAALSFDRLHKVI